MPNHALKKTRKISLSGALYLCSCNAIGYATVSRNLATPATVEAAIKRNHYQHARRANA